MLYKSIIIVFIIVIGGGYAYWDQVRTPPAMVELKNSENMNDGVIVPDIKFQSIDGIEHSLYDFKGKIIILNFWATWCTPCIIEFPELLELANNRPDDLVLIALSVDENARNIPIFLQKHNFETKKSNVIIAHDVGKVISQDTFQTSTYPETFIIAPDLSITKKINGVVEWNKDEEIQNFLKY